MACFMNERKTDSAHVTAARQAHGNEAIIGEGSVLFELDNQFALTVTPSTGVLSVAPGLCSWCGRITGIETAESAKYTPTDSETLFKKITLCFNYKKDTATGNATVSLRVFESETAVSEAAAQALTVNTGERVITAATEEACLPLWSFVANSVSNSSPVMLISSSRSLKAVDKAVKDEIDNRQKAISAEQSARQKAISDEKTARQKAISDEKTAREKEDKSHAERLSNLEGKKLMKLLSSSGTNTLTVNEALATYSAFLIVVWNSRTGNSGANQTLVIPAKSGIKYAAETFIIEEGTLGDQVTRRSYVITVTSLTDTSFKIEGEELPTSSNTAYSLMREIYGIY